MQELLLDLANLHHLHAPAVWSQLARRLLSYRSKIGLWSGGQKRSKELFFEHGESAFQLFDIWLFGTGPDRQPSQSLTHLFRRLPRDANQRGGLEFSRARFKMCGDAFRFKSRSRCLRITSRRSADRSFFHLFNCRHNLLRAVCETIYTTHPRMRSSRLMLFKGSVDAAQYSLEGNACFAPYFYERPVEC